jgi:uncharacterized DUF497 family protein
MALTFEWDGDKARGNLRKHGVSFAEAMSAFQDPLGRIVDDARHSIDEDRLALLALSTRGRLLAVMFTERGERIRLISARRATKPERNSYEEGTGQTSL